MDCRIEQCGEPHRSGNAWPIPHDPAKRVMAHAANFHAPGGIDIVVEPLQSKTVQVDEIARNMHPSYEPLVVSLDGAEDVSLDQDGTAVGPDPPFEQSRAVLVLFHVLDEFFDVVQIIETKISSQPASKEIAGEWEATELDVSRL